MGIRAKNHHYVPRILQRQFTFEGERIWYAMRSQGVYGAPELRNIASTFREKDLYTVLEDGVYSDLVEREYYGGIDNYLGEIIPEVLSAFQRRQVPLFRGKPLEKIRDCALAMARRTPGFSPAIYGGDQERGREFVERALAFYSEVGGAPHRIAALQADLGDPARLRAQGRDIRVRANLSPLEKSEAAIKNFDVRWAVCEQRASLILPSVISFRIGDGETSGLNNPKIEVWMPITPKVAMVLVRDPLKRVPGVTRISRDKVRLINEYAIRLSTSVASHSKALLESLTGQRAKVFGL